MNSLQSWQLETLAEAYARGTLPPADMARFESLARLDQLEKDHEAETDARRLPESCHPC